MEDKMDRDKIIIFDFEGKEYKVSGATYDNDLIQLPDGRVLKVQDWLESDPPIPMELELVNIPRAAKI